MLRAEETLLDKTSVQKMVTIREKSIRYMESRLLHMADIACVMVGFMVEAYTNVAAESNGDVSLTNLGSRRNAAFYMITAAGLVAGIHVLLAATMLSVHGPGLALHGAQGSVLKAYRAMKRERHQVNRGVICLTVFFFIQMVLIYWCKDASKQRTFESTVATTCLSCYMTFTVVSAVRMYRRMYPARYESLRRAFTECGRWRRGRKRARFATREGRTSSEGTATSRRSSVSWFRPTQITGYQKSAYNETGDKGVELLDWMNEHPDFNNGADSFFEDHMLELSPMHLSGLLLKRSTVKRGHRVVEALNAEWQQRFFVLEGTTLRYWKSVKDFKLGKQPCKPDSPIHLHDYDVMVQPDDYDWGITLDPLYNAKRCERTWHLRCRNEHERVKWSQALLSAAMSALEESTPQDAGLVQRKKASYENPHAHFSLRVNEHGR